MLCVWLRTDNFFRSRLPNYEKDMDPMLERILVFYEVGGPLYK